MRLPVCLCPLFALKRRADGKAARRKNSFRVMSRTARNRGFYHFPPPEEDNKG